MGDLKEYVAILIKKAAESCTSLEALERSQAALNVANALAQLKNT